MTQSKPESVMIPVWLVILVVLVGFPTILLINIGMTYLVSLATDHAFAAAYFWLVLFAVGMTVFTTLLAMQNNQGDSSG